MGDMTHNCNKFHSYESNFVTIENIYFSGHETLRIASEKNALDFETTT